MSRSPDPGKKPALLERVIDYFLDKPLSASDVAALEGIVTPDAIGGTRYPAQAMKDLDSEK